jgi:hypothetical protein
LYKLLTRAAVISDTAVSDLNHEKTKRLRNQSQSQVAFQDLIAFAARILRALAITALRDLPNCHRDFARPNRPVSRSTDDARSVLVYVVTLVRLEGIVVLRFYVPMADSNSIQFIGTDAAVKEFLPVCVGIKGPFGIPLHKRHWERPVLVAYEQECAVPTLGINRNAFLFAGLRYEIGGVLPVLCWSWMISRGYVDAARVWANSGSGYRAMGATRESNCSGEILAAWF